VLILYIAIDNVFYRVSIIPNLSLFNYNTDKITMHLLFKFFNIYVLLD